MSNADSIGAENVSAESISLGGVRRVLADYQPVRIDTGIDSLFLASAGLALGLLAWGVIGQLDVVSNAKGEIVPFGQIKSVQHLEGGIVSAIYVQEGQTVEAGQPLIQLDPTKVDSETDELMERLAALSVDIARLEAELTGQQPQFTAEARERSPDLVRRADEVFRTRRDRLASQVAVQRSVIAQREQSLRETRARLDASSRTIELLSEQVSISERLLKQDITSRMTHLNLMRERAVVAGRIEEDRAALLRIQESLNEGRSQLESIQRSHTEEARKLLDEAQRSYSELSLRLVKYKDSQARLILRAPVTGTVKTLRVFTVGGVVKPADTILDVVPAEDRLVVDAKLPTQDIGYVREGQTVMVTLASNDAARFGKLPGRVIAVSPDTLVTREGTPFYRIRIETERPHFEAGPHRYQLYPGMEVLCSIHTGTRSVFEYLFSPFIRSVGVALQER